MRKKFKYFTTALLFGFGMMSIAMCATCVYTPTNLKHRAIPSYKNLSSDDRDTVQRIVDKINKLPEKEQDYYNKKLNALLSTPTAKKDSAEKKEFAKRRKKALSKASRRATKRVASMPEKDRDIFLSAEEEYEKCGKRNWEAYQPNKNDVPFLVDRVDPTNILVRIQVYVDGKREVVQKIHDMEDAVEKHLNIPGFSVNLVFVDKESSEAFTVKSDLDKWVTAHNWGGSHRALAHELLHLMGLPDEYDGIASHAQNKHLSMSARLWYFEKQLDEPFLPDAEYGIMSDHSNRPLHRHVCAAVGLEEKPCVKKRLQFFGE